MPADRREDAAAEWATYDIHSQGVVSLDDIESCIRLVRGTSLPEDMQAWRDGLLRRLQQVVDEPTGRLLGPCPAGHGDQCCGYPNLCAAELQRRQFGSSRDPEAAT